LLAATCLIFPILRLARRTVVHVTPNKRTGDWNVKKSGSNIGTFERKSDAVEVGKDIAKGAGHGQIVIHRQDGTIQTEHTYGGDPHPPKG
jgi:hypothetical protein